MSEWLMKIACGIHTHFSPKVLHAMPATNQPVSLMEKLAVPHHEKRNGNEHGNDVPPVHANEYALTFKKNVQPQSEIAKTVAFSMERLHLSLRSISTLPTYYLPTHPFMPLLLQLTAAHLRALADDLR